jgi:predicted Zn-dependent protease
MAPRMPNAALTSLSVVVLLAACVTDQGQSQRSSSPPPPSTDIQVPMNLPPSPQTGERPPAANLPKTIQDSGVSSAALYLYKEAQSARAAGRADHALALLQRALHVDPRNPFIWQALADTQLNLQQPDQAESAAQKSSSLARGNPYVDAGNWRIIAAARQAQGDASGALRAQAQADQAARALSATP